MMKRVMRNLMITGAAALTLALGGCATTVRSDVTTFQQWPVQMQDKSYSFTAPSPQEDTLELRTYQNLVRGQLARLGFNEAQGTPALHVSMRFMTTGATAFTARAALAAITAARSLPAARISAALADRLTTSTKKTATSASCRS
jgi:hypothetical protein